MKWGSELCETQEGVGTCTNSASGPVVSGKHRSFGILYCVHELVECSSEGRILLWSVDADAALQRHVSKVRKNSTQYDCTHPDAADLRMGLEHE